jgi:ribosomal protein L44E
MHIRTISAPHFTENPGFPAYKSPGNTHDMVCFRNTHDMYLQMGSPTGQVSEMCKLVACQHWFLIVVPHTHRTATGGLQVARADTGSVFPGRHTNFAPGRKNWQHNKQVLVVPCSSCTTKQLKGRSSHLIVLHLGNGTKIFCRS